MSFPQISDDPGEVFARFGVPVQPALVVFSADGSTETVLGAIDDATLDSLLGEASA